MRSQISVTAVVRTSATVVTITLPAITYYIKPFSGTETLTVTVPATALVGAAPIVATPTFTISPNLGLFTGVT
jgi:hypothetical protein